MRVHGWPGVVFEVMVRDVGSGGLAGIVGAWVFVLRGAIVSYGKINRHVDAFCL